MRRIILPRSGLVQRGQTRQEGAGFGGPKGQRCALIVHSRARSQVKRAEIIRLLSNADSRGARLTPGSGMNNTEAGALLARLHADLLPCAADVRRRLSASEKYIIGFKDSSTKHNVRLSLFGAILNQLGVVCKLAGSLNGAARQSRSLRARLCFIRR